MTQPKNDTNPPPALRASETGSPRLSVDDATEEPGMEFLDGAPRVRRFSGSLPSAASKDDYYRYLEAKCGVPSDQQD